VGQVFHALLLKKKKRKEVIKKKERETDPKEGTSKSRAAISQREEKKAKTISLSGASVEGKGEDRKEEKKRLLNHGRQDKKDNSGLLQGKGNAREKREGERSLAEGGASVGESRLSCDC